MIYLSQLLGNPVLDANGERIGVVNDLGIATREVFPRVTSLAFQGPGKTPFMISWRKYVDSFDDGEGKALLAKWGVEGEWRGIGHCILGYADEGGEKPAAERLAGRVTYVK